VIIILLAALAQDPAATGRWVFSADSTLLQTTSVEQRDAQMVARTPRDTFTKPRFGLLCGRYRSVGIAGPNVPDGDQPFTYRIDQDRTVPGTARQHFQNVTPSACRGP